MAAQHDIELMQLVDGELGERADAKLEARLESDPEARDKIEALTQLDELMRGHLELAADDVPERRFEAVWRAIDQATAVAEPARTGVWARITGWLDRHRGHLITGAVSAGAVAALALVLRPGDGPEQAAQLRPTTAIDVRPAAMRTAPEIEALDTPDGEGTVLNLEDEDGHTTVIWVTPADTVEGI
jgi:anti-sigma factor RsiW